MECPGAYSSWARQPATVSHRALRPRLAGTQRRLGSSSRSRLRKAALDRLDGTIPRPSRIEAHGAGLYAKSLNGDAFSDDLKRKAIALIKADLGEVDAVIYSLASPRRTHPKTGEIFKSVLKPIGAPYTAKTVDTDKGVVSDITIQPATEQEIQDTVQVMGGEDWEMWIDALAAGGVLANGATTVAYSYIGPKVTWAIYRNGTIGRAKENLEAAAARITGKLKTSGGHAYVSINKALVTQASSAIPVVPLYISLLYRLMKEKGLHEGCIEQIQRLFSRSPLQRRVPAARQ